MEISLLGLAATRPGRPWLDLDLDLRSRGQHTGVKDLEPG